ncbi:MAG: Gfo/Idh/MocA family oxidoreductase [Candidatus Glassbacteria bacterium]
MRKLALVGVNNSHPYLFAGYVNGGNRAKFVANCPAWAHYLFPEHDWAGEYGKDWHFSTIWSRNVPFARRVQEAVLVDKLVDTIEEATDSTEGAFVCDMWGDYHREQALPFLERGKPVFVDKPLSETVADARAMIEAARNGGTSLSTCSALRFDPALVELKAKMAAAGEKPSIVTVSGPCYQDLARYSVHSIEVMVEVTDSLPVAVLRNISRGIRRHLLLLEFENGACGVIHSWENHTYSVAVTTDRDHRYAMQLGQRDSTGIMMGRVLEAFAANRPLVTYESALEVIRIIEAGKQSAAAGGAETAVAGR